MALNALGRVWAEVNLDALRNNFHAAKSLLGGKKMLVVLKADAYGHGSKEVAECLAEEGVDMFGVASIEEGIELRKEGIRTPILILSPTPYDGVEGIFEYSLTPTVTEPQFAKILTREAKKWGVRVKIHIEVDTGMGRTGFSMDEALDFIKDVKRNPHLDLEGIFTHFPAADSDREFTALQIRRFEKLLKRLSRAGVNPPLTHTANSAAFLNIRESWFDMIRPGLIIYGILPAKTDENISLKPVLSLKTRVVNLRYLPKGTSISYNRTFTTKSDSMIAVLSVGYGDGYPRALSNKGEVLIKGRRAKIVGTVCMDLTMVDVNGFDNIKIDDEVTLIGEIGKERITVNEVASWADTIPYEITSRISPRVPRVYIGDGRIKKVKTLLNRR